MGAVAKMERDYSSVPLPKKEKGVTPASCVTPHSQAEMLVRRVGIEPTTEVNAGLQKAAGHTVNHTQDKDLAEVTQAWSSLAEPLRAAVLALVRSAQSKGGAE